MKSKPNRQIIILAVLMTFITLWSINEAAISSSDPLVDKIISPQDAEKISLNMVNDYFVQGKNAVISAGTTEESGLYKVSISVDNNMQPVYLTKDGKFLIFPNGMIDIAVFEEQAKKQKEKPPIPKIDKPTVELYVMSLCPFGVKAEKEILPVIAGFGDRIDFSIKYITKVKGSSIAEIESLHGPDEVRENLRQAAVFRYYPDKFSLYLDKIAEKSCLISCGELKLDIYWREVAKKLKVDAKKIESFVNGQEGLNLLKQNEADANKYSVDSSPTLVINGVKSDAIYGGPKAVQEAIDSAFSHEPEFSGQAY